MTAMTLPVAAIETGTVIDHILPGQAIAIVSHLKWSKHKQCVTIGINLPSDRQNIKDMIKLENKHLTEEEAKQIAIFSPNATINTILDFKVQEKLSVTLPETIRSLFCCSNPNCVTHQEPITSCFYVIPRKPYVRLKCRYCSKSDFLHHFLPGVTL